MSYRYAIRPRQGCASIERRFADRRLQALALAGRLAETTRHEQIVVDQRFARIDHVRKPMQEIRRYPYRFCPGCLQKLERIYLKSGIDGTVTGGLFLTWDKGVMQYRAQTGSPTLPLMAHHPPQATCPDCGVTLPVDGQLALTHDEAGYTQRFRYCWRG